MLVFWLNAFICKVAFFLTIIASHLIDIAKSLLLFTLNDIVSYYQGGVFFLWHSHFFFLQLGLVGSLKRDGVGVLLLVDFTSLGLNSLVRSFLAVIAWVYTFKEVLWDGQWPLRQQASESQIIVLNHRPALASAWTTL